MEDDGEVGQRDEGRGDRHEDEIGYQVVHQPDDQVHCAAPLHES